MTLTTLVLGTTASVREAAIAAVLNPDLHSALILEGLPDGSSRLDGFAQQPHIQLARIAPGCLCCTGNLTLRVTLNRMLRRPPARLYIGIANPTHLERLRAFLTEAPYDHLLQLTKDLHA